MVDNIYLFETYLDVFLHVEQSWANLHWSACLWAITDNSSSQTWNNNFSLKCESSQTEQKLSALEINMTLHKNFIGPFQLLDMSEHHLKNVCRKSLAGSIHLSSQKKKGPANSHFIKIYLFVQVQFREHNPCHLKSVDVNIKPSYPTFLPQYYLNNLFKLNIFIQFPTFEMMTLTNKLNPYQPDILVLDKSGHKK